jgi:D-alanyl-D-alanine carboxypeptidase/D-alanyl-D-alanine-endopeptidase (penicillin-binding protein 4)
MLAGAVSGLATAAFSQAPLTSVRPVARVQPRDAIAKLVQNSGMSGDVGVRVVDLETGEVLESISDAIAQPPASVTKAFTALYAVETLGATHVFKTRLFADGDIENGILNGNLILTGSGDPELDTDDLAELARALKATGLTEVKGEFRVWDDALRNTDEIDSGQLDHLGYNPTITGLNLNYNRVHFEWKREDDDFVTTMDARSTNYRPAVTTSRIEVIDRQSPIFTYRDLGNADAWTVAKQSLNDAGSRWLPVRYPALYAGEVFATFARSNGIVLQAPQETMEEPTGTPLAEYTGRSLTEVMRGMLRYSTNLTAEVSGLAATNKRAGQRRGLRTSAFGMSQWISDRCGGIDPAFVDHSGLGDRSRVSVADTVAMLAATNVQDTLEPMMREIRLVGDNQQVIARDGMQVRAKTGTLNFVSTLAGYVRTDKGRNLAFAIFASDLEAREAGKREGAERPTGARSWNRRARALQQDIIKHLALLSAA